uniref:Cytochrome c oxidase subunit 2 n=1 Tax=Thysanoteuthis rhombus TaxID=61751 RepID=D2K896_THYRH|nr:cytochrome c oxidase subunit II [Thysanoteuthis rhombus]YP_010184523.1 cytochrome c oxidase subunit II [Thysanoteuthis rhombus]ACZ72736.1 cytochrome c oxidase subunit 2 [Thysanoteuthis rhombus]ACZ72741.1 cytochrome c oxidase subunit 2 [Thysanoteuthis rhombus]QVH33943.1 cytochrome oxidase subunit 2 [Thysanoteuthis rhombus]QVH33955.1 cytochrome oxidase subunit 2 [Thysanoteuthis rhombus]
MTYWGQLGFQDACSPLMEQIIFFHDHAMFAIIMVLTMVMYMAMILMTNKFSCLNITESQKIETIWTVAPALILLFLALPSLRLLYLLDETNDPLITIKTMGHQWYWSYEYSDFLDIEFDSYMIPTNELDLGNFRLLETDHHLILPMKTNTRIIVSSADVIHSWTVPSLGVKVDAIPGRLNQLMLYPSRPGLYYGQCSEICGANHSFMPITLEIVNMDYFIKWLNLMNEQ